MERSWACKDLKEILRHAEKSLRPTQQIREVNSQHKDYVLDIVTAMFHSIPYMGKIRQYIKQKISRFSIQREKHVKKKMK